MRQRAHGVEVAPPPPPAAPAAYTPAARRARPPPRGRHRTRGASRWQWVSIQAGMRRSCLGRPRRARNGPHRVAAPQQRRDPVAQLRRHVCERAGSVDRQPGCRGAAWTLDRAGCLPTRMHEPTQRDNVKLSSKNCPLSARCRSASRRFTAHRAAARLRLCPRRLSKHRRRRRRPKPLHQQQHPRSNPAPANARSGAMSQPSPGVVLERCWPWP